MLLETAHSTNRIYQIAIWFALCVTAFVVPSASASSSPTANLALNPSFEIEDEGADRTGTGEVEWWGRIEKLLFHIGLSFQSELDQGILSQEFEQEFEDRTIPVSGGKFSDTFAGYQRHVYKIVP